MQASLVERLYDAFSQRYWKWNPSAHFRTAHAESVGKLLGRFGQARPLRIAELGCGHGTWLKLVLDDLRSRGLRCAALGLDLSAQRLELAREHLRDYPEVSLQKADLLGFQPDGQFDLVYAYEVFQYFSADEQLRIVDRWTSHLAPGGALVILDKDLWSRHSLICEAQKALGPLDFVLGPLRKFPPELRALHETIRYPDFRRLARALAARSGLELELGGHAEFTFMIVRRG